jgi:hypothetical protein
MISDFFQCPSMNIRPKAQTVHAPSAGMGLKCFKGSMKSPFPHAPINEKPFSSCPECGEKIKKIISWCHSAVVEPPDGHLNVEKKIKDYEQSGMWSHAAELADKHSEKIKDRDLKMRALDNYKKAGYDADSLAKHAKLNDE